MKLKLVFLVSALAAAGAANADLLSYYNFNDASTSGTSAANAALLLSADGGTLKTTTSLATTAALVNVVSFTGTLTNAIEPSGTTPNAALAIQAGTNNANNGTNLTLTTAAPAGSTLSGLSFSFAGQRTGTGFNSYQLAYSVNGGSFTNFGSAFDLNASTSPGFGNPTTAVAGAIRSFDLSGLGSNISTLSLRVTYSGATTSSANLRLDNLQLNGKVQAVPEPASVAALGLGVAAFIRRRRKA